MSEQQHTPGPRRAVKGGDKKEWERPGCGFVLAADGETVVGRFPRYEDALLDSAAPELLDAAVIGLAWLQDFLQDIYESHCLLDDDLNPKKETLEDSAKDDVANLEEVIANLGAAIAKARGATP